jgi:L-arabinose isomerase
LDAWSRRIVDLGAHRTQLEHRRAKLGRRIRNLLELLNDGQGGGAVAAELRDLERQQDLIVDEVRAIGSPKPVPTLHPQLPEVYRRRVEASGREPA